MTSNDAEVPELDARQAELAHTRGDLTIIDVREHDEWAAGHVGSSQHIPLGELADRLAEVPRNQPIAMMCHLGGRSYQAAKFLRSLGYTKVSNLKGGMDAWETAGLPVERS